MIVQKIDHYFDSHLTKETARIELDQQKVVVALYTNQQDDYSVVHSHPYYEFILPIAGSDVMYSVEGGLYQVHLGELVYFPSELYHSGKYHITGHSSDRMVVQIAESVWLAAEEAVKDALWMNGFFVLNQEAVSSWDIRGLFERMAQSSRLNSDYRNSVFIAQVAELQLLISQILSTKAATSFDTAHPLVAKAVAYLQEHFREPDLTVAKLAQVTYTSREHLSRIFKEYTMESIHSYLTNLRMQHSLRILHSGGTVMDACNESGFSNYNSFLKAFQHQYGITPTKYRAKHFG